MFKPLARSFHTTSRRSDDGFADTHFVHHSEDDDFSGFAPTEMFEDVDMVALPATRASGTTPAARAAASTSRSALERAAIVPAPADAAAAAVPAAEAVAPVGPETSVAPSWVTSPVLAALEAEAHAAARRAHGVIDAQRRGEGQAEAGAAIEPPSAPRTGLGRLRALFDRLLPGDFRSLLPLFIGVSVTMALISAVLPLFDKP